MRGSIVSGLAAGLLLAAPLSAQGRNEHKGFWIGFGLGGGVNLSQGLDNDRLWGGAGYLRLGGTPKANVLLGGEVAGWTTSKSGVELNRGVIQFMAQLYPSPKSGFYLKAGIGVAEIERVNSSGSSQTSTSKEGVGLSAGAGYEIQIGRNLHLVPAADLIVQGFKKQTDPVLGNIPGTNAIAMFTLGLTWH
jgi:outer membrane protein with beta-barrel domain